MKTRVTQIGQISLLLLMCAGFTSCNKDEIYSKDFLENPYQDPESTGTVDNGGQGGADAGTDGSTQGGVNGGVNGGTTAGATTGSSSGGMTTGGATTGGTTTGGTTDGGSTAGSTTGGTTDGGATTGGTTDGGATTGGTTDGGTTTGGTTTGGTTTGGTTTGGATPIPASETFHQAERKKMDILWVIDNSGSMADEQNALAWNFDAFINDFIDTDVDFKMAITTTDVSSADKKGKMVANSDVLLTSAKAQENANQFKEDFRTLVKVGTRGSGIESGLAATEGFMEKYRTSFIRPDAYLAVVVLSDEEDSSPKTPTQYMDYLKSFKADPGLVKLYSICDVNAANPEQGTTPGCVKYSQASSATAGTVANILSGNFFSILSGMGDSLINLLDSFALAHDPINGSLVVKVNGSVVSAGTDYTFDAASRSIKFNAGHIPPMNAEITVTYDRY